MYKKNFKSTTYLNLNILLTAFLNRAVISLLNFFLSFKLKKKKILSLLIFILKILCLFFLYLDLNLQYNLTVINLFIFFQIFL